LWKFRDGCRQLGISPERGYRLVRQGKLLALSDGGRNYIAEAELQRYKATLTALELAPPRPDSWSKRPVRDLAADDDDDGPEAEPADEPGPVEPRRRRAASPRRSSGRRRSA
jgi:hypothetical protein